MTENDIHQKAHLSKTSEALNNKGKSASFWGRNSLRFILMAVIIIAVSGTMFFIKSSARASLNRDQEALTHAITVNTTTLQAENHYQVKQKYSGSITAGRESDHGFDRAGLLADVMVDEGDQVHKGDILARLDMRRLNAREQELNADLAQAEALNREAIARLDRAEATFGRYRVLVKKKHISEEKFDQVKFDLIALKARKVATAAAVSKSRAALKSLKIDRDMATLTARFDGSITRRYLDEGTAIAAGTPVVRLIEDKKLEIHVGLPAATASSLTPGELHMFRYQGRKVMAKLRSVLRNVDQSTRTVTAIFDVRDGGENMRAGDLAQFSILSDIEQPGYWLPTGALAESRRGLWSVYSLKPYEGKAEYATLSRQELQVIYTDGERVYVQGTLQNGDRVVTQGIHRLVPGQLVRLSKDDPRDNSRDSQ